MLVSLISAGILFCIILRSNNNHHKNTREGDEEWIELTHRQQRALPAHQETGPATQSIKQREDAAWDKFAEDPMQVRRYVEGLENQLATSSTLAAVGYSPGKVEVSPPPARTSGSISGGLKLNRPKSIKAKGNMPMQRLPRESSTQSLLQASAVGNNSNPFTGPMPQSSTKGSILTELCAAVTEPYSPLAEVGVAGTENHAVR
jgi:hypothetical protein